MLSLYRPQLDDLWFRQALLADPDTMSYNAKWGGAISFPREKWRDWYRRWLVEHEGKRFYRYLLSTEANGFVGEVAYHYDDSQGIFLCDVIVHARHRKNGYGTEGLQLLCEAARENGVAALHDHIAPGNPSLQLFLRNGFAIDFQTEDGVMVGRAL